MDDDLEMMVENWFNEITFGDRKNINSYIRKTSEVEGSPEKTEIRIKFIFYTNDHQYTISAVERFPGKSYLGCVSNCRKSKAGEDWTRGSDLPDGLLNNETWNRIKNAIIRNELVRLDPLTGVNRNLPDEDVQSPTGTCEI